MDSSRGYDRGRQMRSRSRAGKQRGREGDAITAALSVQILLCALVLLAFTAIKRVDNQSYQQMLVEYGDLVGQDAGDLLDDYFQELGGLGQGFFGTVEGLVQRLFGGGTPEPEQPRQQPADETVETGEPQYAIVDYGTGAGEEILLGAGGYNPVAGAQAEPGEDVYLPAPEGSTLAPVYLMASVRPPVTGRVTSLFAYRVHPITGEADFHNGMDIAAEEGRGVLAALPGEVVEVGESDIYGNYIILQHATNLQTFYAHCSEIIATEGMAVRQGQRIAKVGKTGMATGPHLHFSVIVDGLYTDPRYVLEDYLVLVEES